VRWLVVFTSWFDVFFHCTDVGGNTQLFILSHLLTFYLTCTHTHAAHTHTHTHTHTYTHAAHT